MLSLLRVENLAIIDRIEVELGPGLNVVTGETGAGKSILVSALRLVLGARADGGVVRTGAEAAEVEALFDLSDHPEALARLAAEGLGGEPEVVVRRVVQASGRSRAYVNGRLATVGHLARLAAGLVDISSQHAHHTLVDRRTHLGFLDAFAGLVGRREAVGRAHAALVAADRALAEVRDAARQRAEREDLLRYQLQEIDVADLSEEAVREWREQAQRLRHAEHLVRAAAAAEHALYAREGAICARLAGITSELRGAVARDPSLGPVVDAVEGARAELEEAARRLGAYARSLDADPGHLAELDERLAEVKRLERKYGGDVGALLRRAEEMRAELDALASLEARLDGAERAVGAALAAASAAARELSAARRQAAEGLGAAITAELADLGMGDARVEVDVAPRQGAGGFEVDGAQLSAEGLDRVEFLIAPNPGEEPRPLQEIASGGELSRALLGLKRVLARGGPVGTYVFDEVDTGVGGGVAEVIGRKLADVARHHQVLCITHLPQVAAYGARHLHVRKEVVEGRTRTAVQRLVDGERVEELARMLGGLRITEATRRAAEELVAGAAGLA